MTEEEKNKRKVAQEKYRLKNKNILAQKSKEYKKANKSKIKLASKEYYVKNRKQVLNKSKEYYQKNNKKRNEYNSQYKKENRVKLNSQLKLKRQTDYVYKLSCNIRNLIKECFKRRKHTKTSKTVDILGCSIEDFKIYIESKFESWMNWDNHGKLNNDIKTWQLDHIKPISMAKNKEDLIKLCHFSNYQPLEAQKNLAKWNKFN